MLTAIIGVGLLLFGMAIGWHGGIAEERRMQRWREEAMRRARGGRQALSSAEERENG